MAIEHKISEVAANSSYTISGLFAGIGALTLEQWTFLIGIALGVGTFLVNWYYKKEHLKLLKKQMDQGKKDDT